MKTLLTFLVIVVVSTAGLVALRWKDNAQPSTASILLPENVTIERIAPMDESTQLQALSIDPLGRPLAAIGNRIAVLARSGQQEGGQVVYDELNRIEDLCWVDGQGVLMISGKGLYKSTTVGVELLIDLPSTGMRISPAGEDRCYVYGGSTHSVYGVRVGSRVFGGATPPKKVIELVRCEDRVSAVAGSGEVTYLAIENMIYSFEPGQDLAAIHETEKPVRSLAMRPKASVFFTTSDGVGICGRGRGGMVFAEVADATIASREEDLVIAAPGYGIVAASPTRYLSAMLSDEEVTRCDTSDAAEKAARLLPMPPSSESSTGTPTSLGWIGLLGLGGVVLLIPCVSLWANINATRRKQQSPQEMCAAGVGLAFVTVMLLWLVLATYEQTAQVRPGPVRTEVAVAVNSSVAQEDHADVEPARQTNQSSRSGRVVASQPASQLTGNALVVILTNRQTVKVRRYPPIFTDNYTADMERKLGQFNDDHSTPVRIRAAADAAAMARARSSSGVRVPMGWSMMTKG